MSTRPCWHLLPYATPPAMSVPAKQYGQLSWTESLHLVATSISLPIVLPWSVATSVCASHNKERSLKRIIADCTLRYLASHLSVTQMQAALGTTLRTYELWSQWAKLPMTIDELGEDARLLWIGPKRLERVVLYMHGGGFCIGSTYNHMRFWRYVQLELEKQNIEVGFALLNYSLVPQASFPTPLKQAGLALDFLMAAGVKPQNLQLAGDSAGGNLILQVLSQMLHPLKGVPEIRLPAPLRGVYLISPWTNLHADSKSHMENEGLDFVSQRQLADMGAWILEGVLEADRAFADAVRAPEGWYKGIDGLVERVLVTAGGAELLRDDIVVVGEMLKKYHANTELVVQKDGLHEDMFLDFVLGEKKLGSLTPLTVEWLAAGFTEEPSVIRNVL
ncbi:Abhydrolase-3 domain-containing protein [Mycena venus]|uniref:Abhydrolase-3 domain-containing protein n=1 Tax=Mycena venus TaxID=2733690 RepID=A0A8H6U1B6_9AGAR|nr:Abhydrolase-3 domain-containing protein [Mycena venus]